MDTRGILLCAWGKDCYGYAAFNFAASIKFFSPAISITLITDGHAIRQLGDNHKKVFDDIIVLGEPVSDPGLFKASIYNRLPYDYTLFLDVDALALNPVEKLLDQLIEDFESDPSKFLRCHVHAWYDHTSTEDMPMMYWATKSVVWDHYGFDQTHRIPGTQSSLIFIAKSPQAEKFYSDMAEMMQSDPIPIEQLKNRWGGTQPDELYLNVQIAKCHLTPDIEKAIWFCDNSNYKPFQLKALGYTVLSYFGVRQQIKVCFKEYYDKEPIRFLRALGFPNHLWKSKQLLDSKHAGNKQPQIKRELRNYNEQVHQKRADMEVFKPTSSRSIKLVTSYYTCKSEARQKELIRCIENNLASPHITEVILATECEVPITHPKLKTIATGRLTMRGLVELANQHSTDITILCNSDIYMHDSIGMVKDFNLDSKVLCLSRWNQTATGGLHFIDAEYSQDTWIWESQLQFKGGDYNFGLLGCDNKFAYDVHQSGYMVLNPARHIKTVHLHLCGERNYSEKTRLPQPYLNVPVSTIEHLKPKRLLIKQPGKVGDIIICLPIANYYARQGYKVEWLCPDIYHPLFSYVDYVTPISRIGKGYDKEIDLSFGLDSRSSVHFKWIARKPSLDSFVTLKYELASVPLSELSNLQYHRNEKNENALFKVLGCDQMGDYILAHRSSDYGTPIDIPSHYPVVDFVQNGSFSIFDWRKVIEGAKEIHCIDSSLVNFADRCDVRGKLFYYKSDRVPMKADETMLLKNWERINLLEYANS